MTATAPPPVPDPLIPAPDVVLNRLTRLRIEARFLARLLRLSEDHIRALPVQVKPTAAAEVKEACA